MNGPDALTYVFAEPILTKRLTLRLMTRMTGDDDSLQLAATFRQDLWFTGSAQTPG